MKTKVLFIALLATTLFSCNNDIDDMAAENRELTSVENETVSGTLTPENPSQTVRIGNSQVELFLEDSSATRAIGDGGAPKDGYGPFYSQGTPIKIKSDVKLRITSTKYGLVKGYYFCDVYKVSNTVNLPEEAWVAKVGFPNPAGFKDYSDQTEGVNWTVSTTANDQISIDWTFYTLVVKYNMAGQTLNKVIPVDGAKVKVPYYYK